MKKCEVCGKRAEGLGTYPVVFQRTTICANCYESLKAFKNGRKFSSVENAKQRATLAHQEMIEKQYPTHVVDEIDHWFQQVIKTYEDHQKANDIDDKLDDFMMTTGYTFEGYRIIQYHGIISGESVLGTGFMSSWDASLSDVLGVESDAFINKLKGVSKITWGKSKIGNKTAWGKTNPNHVGNNRCCVKSMPIIFLS